MKKAMMGMALALAAGTLLAGVEIAVSVDPTKEVGPIKRMNAVNNGPSIPLDNGTQVRGNFDAYAKARFPFARLHDSINCVSGGAHAVDISAIFPNFDADEKDPKSYDFEFTDTYLKAIRKAGTGVFFRLGQTIEHGTKKYWILPPKDFAKWARVCEHVIRHYDENWADGYNFNVVYWEIFNEPDLRYDRVKTSPTWQGTPEQYFELYEITAKHLKKCFPWIKVGGPASAGRMEWCDRFLAYCKEHEAPLDFFSWHIYDVSPRAIAKRARECRALMEKHGFGKAESILNEWNYVRGWTDDWVYSLRVESGDLCLKGGAFCASVLSACQDAPVDMLMYYDARTSTTMNGLFERTTLWPQKPYYAFYPWAKLSDLGTQVAASVAAPTNRFGETTCYVTAAKGADGALGLYFARYSEDDMESKPATITLRVKGRSLAGATCHLTDPCRTYTEVPLTVNADGSATLFVQPLTYGYVELPSEKTAKVPLECRRLGITLNAPKPGDVDRYCDFIKNRLAKDGFDTLVMLTRYNYKFEKHLECADRDAIGKADVKKIVAACRAAGVTLIPKMNLLGHQGEGKGVVKGGLLKAYPDMDESFGKDKVPNDYCRSLCPQHPKVQALVFELMDELVDACEAKAVHVGCDEVFDLGTCPRCAKIPNAALFADWVNGLNRHNRDRGVETMIWADRLLDHKKTPYHIWESSDNGTAAALALVDKDVVLCDWHYEWCDSYPSVETFGDAGFRAWVCPWRYLDHAKLFIDYAKRHERNHNLVGIMLTTWYGFADFADAVEGKPLREGLDAKAQQTLRCLSEVYRAYKRN